MLLSNNHSLHALPVKLNTGSPLVSFSRYCYSQSGTLGNIHLNQNSRRDQVSVPMGYYRGTWVLPQKIGAITARYTMDGIGNLTLTGARGRGSTITFSGEGLLSATANKIAAITVSMSGSGDLTATGKALLAAIVNMSGNGTLSAMLKGNGRGVVTMTGLGTVTYSIKGNGEMELIINVNQSEASAQQIANAVWSDTAAYTGNQKGKKLDTTEKLTKYNATK